MEVLSVRIGKERTRANFSWGCWITPVPGSPPFRSCRTVDYHDPGEGSVISVSADHLVLRTGARAAGIEVTYAGRGDRHGVRRARPVGTAGRLWTAKLPPGAGIVRFVAFAVDYRYVADGVTLGGISHFRLGYIRRTR